MKNRTITRSSRSNRPQPKKTSRSRAARKANESAAYIPAKLSAPRLLEAVPRERLFRWLDQHYKYPLIWIAGPPGSGKTILVASYFERSPRTVLWYRADAGDSDLATVFYHLREAVRVIRGQDAEQLPLLTPEYLLDVATYARNFVRAMFALLPSRTTIVFDNLQDMAEGTVDLVLKTAVMEAPHSVRLVAISRNEPPPTITALQMKGMLATLDWTELRLTVEEAQDIASMEGFSDATFVRNQHAACDGWVAGFNLLIQHTKRLNAGASLQPAQTRSALFNYFTSELFASGTPAGQRLVLCTALLPNFTLTQASMYATREKAEEVIDWLLKHNFFIDRRAGEEPVYFYHDLFREFLLDRGRSVFTPAERRAFLQQAAWSAEENRQLEVALSLLIEAELWSDAVRLLNSLAPHVLQQGRNASLDRWIGSLPPTLVSATPWMLYWQGMARLSIDPCLAQLSFEAAYVQFETSGDLTACLLTCAGIFQCFFFEWGDQRPLDIWVEKYRSLVATPGFEIPAGIDAQVIASMLGLLMRYFGDPLLDSSFERARQLIGRGIDPSQQAPLIFFILTYCAIKGLWTETLPFLNHLERAIDASTPPVTQLYGCATRLAFCSMCSESASETEGRSLIRHFIALTEHSGIRILDIFGLAQGTCFALNWRDSSLAQELIQRMRHSVQPQRIMDVAHYHWFSGMVALERGDLASATMHTKACFDHSVACGLRLGMCQNYLLSALVHCAFGDTQLALNDVERMIELTREMRVGVMVHSGLLVRAFILLRSGNVSAGLKPLREGLELGRSTGQSIIIPAAPSQVTSYLYAVAIRHGIEMDYVRKLIKIYRIPPPKADLVSLLDLERWPWPLRIYTMGRFALLKHDVPIKMTRKVQKRPLQLLHALIALGGRSVSIDALARQVWPGRDGEAKAILHVALTRLRRLLGDPRALTLISGKLTLNEQVCWVDVWAFERGMADINKENCPADGYQDTLNLYRGAFLSDDDELICISRMRERLAAKFQRAALRVGKKLEYESQWDTATDIYRYGLERDVSNEEFYRRLMYCEWKLGRRAAAIKHYQHCHELLALKFRTKPSLETERMYQRIQTE